MGNLRQRMKNGRFVLAGKITGLALAAVFLLLFVSCGGKTEETVGNAGRATAGTGASSSESVQNITENLGREVTDAYDSPSLSAELEDGQETVTPVIQNAGIGQGHSDSSREAGTDWGNADSSQDSDAGRQPSVLESGLPGATQEMTVHFLDVGQGDATLILCGGEAMLIDAGDNSQGTNIQNYLQKQGIETLKYVVCTHPDEDHIGGMDVILYKFNCETVLITEEEKDTNTYRDVADTMARKGYKKTLPVPGQQYLLGDAVFTILGPSTPGSDSNNNSIVILLTHGEDAFLFTGDAEEEEESALIAGGLSLDADVYKAGHHGSRTSSSKELLEAVSPTCAVISCGEGNSYGHPHAETLNNLRAMGVSVYRTDEQGTVVAASSGKGITWNCSPSETWLAGEPTGSAASSVPGAGQNASTSQDAAQGASHGQNVTQGTSVSQDVTQGAFQGQDVTQGTSGSQDAIQGDSGGQDAVQGASHSQGAVEEPAGGFATPSYICNTNTHKFHYPSCGSVKQMKESNKLPTNAAREELIQQGYEPCKRCNP